MFLIQVTASHALLILFSVLCTSTQPFCFFFLLLCFQILKSQGSEKKIVGWWRVMTCKIVAFLQQISCLPILLTCLCEGFSTYFLWDICLVTLAHHSKVSNKVHYYISLWVIIYSLKSSFFWITFLKILMNQKSKIKVV